MSWFKVDHILKDKNNLKEIHCERLQGIIWQENSSIDLTNQNTQTNTNWYFKNLYMYKGFAKIFFLDDQVFKTNNLI